MRARGGPWRGTDRQDSTRRINQDPTLGRSDERGGEGGKLVAIGGRTKWKKAEDDDDIGTWAGWLPTHFLSTSPVAPVAEQTNSHATPHFTLLLCP